MPELRDTGVRNVVCGENVVIYQPANLYNCQLGDNVFVGPFVEIQGNTRIGANSKIQSHTFICEYVTIGQRCFIGGDRRGQRGNEVHYRERRVGGESGEAAAAAINKNADQRVGIPS